VFVPVGAEHLETANLGGAADMFADTRTNVVVTDAHKTDGVGGIVGQAGLVDLLRQLVAADKLEGHGQVCFDELIHPTLNLLLFLATGLLIEVETHLALFPLDMGIVGAITTEYALHRLIQQMLCGMRWGKFLLVVLIEYIIGHILYFFGAKIQIKSKKNKCFATFWWVGTSNRQRINN